MQIKSYRNTYKRRFNKAEWEINTVEPKVFKYSPGNIELIKLLVSKGYKFSNNAVEMALRFGDKNSQKFTKSDLIHQFYFEIIDYICELKLPVKQESAIFGLKGLAFYCKFDTFKSFLNHYQSQGHKIDAKTKTELAETINSKCDESFKEFIDSLS